MTTPASLDGSGNREFKQRILEVMPKVIRVALEPANATLSHAWNAVEAQLREADVTVVVLGQFSSGKSTLLNALLRSLRAFSPWTPTCRHGW